MSLAELTSTYPYLLAVLAGLPPVALAFVAFADQRRMMGVSGLLLAALTPLGVFFEGDYWNATRLGGGPVGIEDFLMGFSIGSLVWLAATLPVRREVTTSITPRRFAVRFLCVFVAASALLNTLQFLGIAIMTAALIVQAVAVAALLAIGPGLWRLAGASALLYAPYYCLVLYLVSMLADGFFYKLWSGTALWPVRLYGLPLQEILWALSFPPSYALAIAWAADARLARPDAAPAPRTHRPEP
jgi:hypothetical protein